MKRFLVVLVVMFSAFGNLFGATHTLSANLPDIYNVPSYYFDGDFVKFSKVDPSGVPGNPEMPGTYKIKFVLPDDVDFDTVSVTIENLTETEVSSVDIMPFPEIPGTFGEYSEDQFSEGVYYPDGATIVDGKNVAVYETDSFFPENYIESVNKGRYRTTKIVTVYINPYLWNPVQKKLKSVTSGVLKINYTSNDATISVPVSRTNLLKFKELMNTSYTNPSNILVPIPTILPRMRDETETISFINGSFPGPIQLHADSLHVITTETIKSSSTRLLPFLYSKESLPYPFGFEAFVVTEG
jgi:hypothetical protein